MGGIITGGLVILALAVLMPLCAYIPKASLAGNVNKKKIEKKKNLRIFFYKLRLFLAVIITAVIFSVEYEVLQPMWKSKSMF